MSEELPKPMKALVGRCLLARLANVSQWPGLCTIAALRKICGCTACSYTAILYKLSLFGTAGNTSASWRTWFPLATGACSSCCGRSAAPSLSDARSW